jgi:hypothetical protein
MDRDLLSPDNSEQVAKMDDLMPFGLGSPVCGTTIWDGRHERCQCDCCKNFDIVASAEKLLIVL